MARRTDGKRSSGGRGRPEGGVTSARHGLSGSADEQARVIFEMSLDLICIADLRTATFLKVNPAFTAALGYTESELVGRPFLDFVHPEDVASTLQVVADHLRGGGEVVNFRNRYRAKAGGFRWLTWVSRPLATKDISIAVAHDITREVQSTAALEQSEQRFRLMVDFTQSWEYWLEAGKGIVYVTPSCRRYTGYEPEDFLRDESLTRRLVHPEDRERLEAHFDREVDAPGVDALEFRILDREGKERWIEHTCQPISDGAGRFLLRRASNREITDQKRAEKRNAELTEGLQKTSGLLNAILDAIPDVIGVQDPHHRVVRYNEAGYRFLGLSAEQVRGKNCYELIGHDAPCHICATSEVLQTKRAARVEKYVPELDKWLDVRAYPILDQEGNLTQVIEHLRDITHEKKSEAELRAAHERLTTVLDSIDAHIYVSDMESYQILFMNRKMKEDFEAELIGTRCHEAFRGESTPCRHCTNSRLLDERGESTGVLTWEGQNPVTGRWYFNLDRAIRWVDGRMVRIQIATDITQTREYARERSEMERQLFQSQKLEAIGTLAGGIAHDFNNLLMGIQGRTSLMMSDLDTREPHREHLLAIEEHIRSAAGLTRQLLGLARGGKYETSPFDLNELLRASSTMFGRTRKQIRIHLKCCEEPLVVEADRTQIEQVLLNLYVNSWQAMPEGGDLSIESSSVLLGEGFSRSHQVAAGRYARVSVTDTGIGMDEQTRRRAFDPFFSTKGAGRGTGLGLASAYAIVKNHGGRITVESEKGHGARFTILLPASDKPVASPTRSEVELRQGGETVLLVDDEDMILAVARAMLQKLGYRVIAARGGEDAIEELRRDGCHIDLVVLDMIMPGMDGGATFDRLRELRPDLPVILSSGYAEDGQAERILRRGCKGFIQKPFTIGQISLKVRSVLDALPRPGGSPEGDQARSAGG